MELFSLVIKLSKFPVITLNSSREESKHLLLLKCLKQKINPNKFLKGRIKISVAIEMSKTENQSKTPQVVGAIDGTHVFIKAAISKNWRDYYWRKQ